MTASRTRQLADVSRQHWDLVIIGGGITGASLLREARRAGLRTLLLEQRDFAWGASSRSGKWVHGGLRYMKQMQANVTWVSVREREKRCSEFAGMVSMQPMHWLLYKGRRLDEWVIRSALFVYDLMAGKRWRRHVSLQQLEQTFPALAVPDLKGAMCFHEGQTDDARMTLRVIQEAKKAGAVALNYAPVVGLEKVDGLVRGVHVQQDNDAQLFVIKATQVIAATGAWADQLRAQVRRNNNEKLRPLRGSHLVFDSQRLPIHSTIVLEHPQDRRPGFITPFQGRVIIGNTDLDHRQDMHKEASITAAEVEYLLAPIQHYFPALNICREDIIATFSGVRPVVDSGKGDPSAESREHVVWHEDELISIGGGKLTTFQHIALDALQRVKHKFSHMAPLRKHQPVLFEPVPALARPEGLSDEQFQRLVGRYGVAAQQMLAYASESERAVIAGTQTHWFELPWCAAHEDVVHLDDLLLRRTRIGLLLAGGGVAELPRIRHLVQGALYWTDERWEAEKTRYLAIWRAHYSVPEADTDS